MKKYRFIINIILGTGILLAFLTCTDFNPWEAARIINIFWIDDVGSIFHMRSNDEESAERLPVEFPGSDMPTCLTVDRMEGKIYWAYRDMNGAIHIERANYDGTGREEIHYFSDPNFVSSMVIDHSNGMLLFSLGPVIKKAPKNGGIIEDVYHIAGEVINIIDIAFDNSEYAVYFVRDNNLNEYYRKYLDTAFDQPADIIETDGMYLPMFKITYHPWDHRIYWTDSMGTGIWGVFAGEGTGVIQILSNNNYPINDLVSFTREEYLYIAEATFPGDPPLISKISIENPGDREDLYARGGTIYHLAIDFMQ